MKRTFLLALIAVAACGCGKKTTTAKLPAPPPVAATAPKVAKRPVPSPGTGLASTIDELYGLASWYGYPYHGRKTASGEVYDMNQLTAAHRTLAMGTRVEVTNRTNGKQVEVRINDRGPFVEGRVIDLSFAAARQIQMIGPGMVMVSLRRLESPPAPVGAAPDSKLTRFGVQVGAFREKDNAARLQGAIAHRHAPVTIAQSEDRGLYRVLVGAEPAEASAQTLAPPLRNEN